MPSALLAIAADRQLNAVVERLEKNGLVTVTMVENLSAALSKLDDERYRFFLAAVDSLGHGALPLLRRLNRMAPLTDLLILADEAEIEGVVIDRLVSTNAGVAEMVEMITEAIEIRLLLDSAGLFGHSPNLKEAAKRIMQAAPTDISVLITGPSGTGKELIARALHDNSPRRQAEFVSINCASIPETLLESELFGHQRGAFTGAVADRPGLFAQADKGTLFLDEIGEMQASLQAKLLRAIETKSFMPLGARKPAKVDVRLMAATNRQLQQRIQEGQFRADLYYRIGVIEITMKRLAERPEDILPIIAHYLRQAGADLSFSPEATDLLLSYSWPGSVRELLNFLQRLMLTEHRGEISREQVSALLEAYGTADRQLPVVTNVEPEESGFRLVYQALLNLADEIAGLKRTINEHFSGASARQERRSPATSSGREMEVMEEKLIREALGRFDGNRKRVASYLGIGERTLYRKLRKYGIT